MSDWWIVISEICEEKKQFDCRCWKNENYGIIIKIEDLRERDEKDGRKRK